MFVGVRTERAIIISFPPFVFKTFFIYTTSKKKQVGTNKIVIELKNLAALCFPNTLCEGRKRRPLHRPVGVLLCPSPDKR